MRPRVEGVSFVEVLYGSMARGDDDIFSDVDLLIIDDNADRQPSLSSATIVQYTWSEFSEMASYGSLFLWHLRMEGRTLSADDDGRIAYRGILDDLPRYNRSSSDLE